MPDILALGEPLVEFVEHGDGLWKMGFGGDTMNAAISARRQGARVGMISALGQDLFADALRALWAREGLADFAPADPHAPTGVYFVRPHASGRDFTYLRAGSAASRYRAEDLPAEAIAAARVLHVSAISQAVGGRMRNAVERAVVMAREAGTTISYDTNLRLKLWDLETAREVILATLARADIAFPSDDEAAQIFGLDTPEAVLDAVLELGPRIVVLKSGAEGAWLATREGRTRIPPAPVAKAVDATGAGDAFAGAFLAHWVRTGDPTGAAHAAAEVAAAVVAGYGAIEPIPRRAEEEDQR